MSSKRRRIRPQWLDENDDKQEEIPSQLSQADDLLLLDGTITSNNNDIIENTSVDRDGVVKVNDLNHKKTTTTTTISPYSFDKISNEEDPDIDVAMSSKDTHKQSSPPGEFSISREIIQRFQDDHDGCIKSKASTFGWQDVVFVIVLLPLYILKFAASKLGVAPKNSSKFNINYIIACVGAFRTNNIEYMMVGMVLIVFILNFLLCFITGYSIIGIVTQFLMFVELAASLILNIIVIVLSIVFSTYYIKEAQVHNPVIFPASFIVTIPSMFYIWDFDDCVHPYHHIVMILIYSIPVSFFISMCSLYIRNGLRNLSDEQFVASSGRHKYLRLAISRFTQIILNGAVFVLLFCLLTTWYMPSPLTFNVVKSFATSSEGITIIAKSMVGLNYFGLFVRALGILSCIIVLLSSLAAAIYKISNDLYNNVVIGDRASMSKIHLRWNANVTEKQLRDYSLKKLSLYIACRMGASKSEASQILKFDNVFQALNSSSHWTFTLMAIMKWIGLRDLKDSFHDTWETSERRNLHILNIIVIAALDWNSMMLAKFAVGPLVYTFLLGYSVWIAKKEDPILQLSSMCGVFTRTSIPSEMLTDGESSWNQLSPNIV